MGFDRKAVRHVLVAAVSLLPLAAFADERLITVTGEGRVTAAPDMAVLTLGVTEEARTAGAALGAMSAAGEAILATLTAAGVEARDVQTQGLNLYPVYDHTTEGRPKVTGFAASTDFTIVARDLDGVGALLDALVGAGSNQLGGIRFEIAEPRALEDEARVAAVADARAKAELLAGAAGVTLGGVVSIDEITLSGGPVMLAEARMMDAAMPVPVAEGEVAIEAQVTMVFAIAE